MAGVDPRLREAAYAFQSHLGFELVEWSDGFARVEVPLGPHLMNRQGIVHGGVHATLLDTAMGYSGCFTGDPDRRLMALTLSLNVNYVGRSEGLRLVAEARVRGGGRSTFFADGTLTDDTARLVATASGVFRYRKDAGAPEVSP